MALGLYPRLLGVGWNEVAPSIRRLHLESGPVRMAGTFCVRHGKSRLTRWLIRVLRLPAEGDDLPTRLVVERQGDGERLLRTFADRPFVTIERVAGNGLLAERFGLMELRFRLEVQNGAILHRHMATTVRLGALAIPLPGWLAPQVTASEQPIPGTDQAQVCVQVVVPWVGLLISYEGTVAREEMP
jgi:hypothetical protein